MLPLSRLISWCCIPLTVTLTHNGINIRKVDFTDSVTSKLDLYNNHLNHTYQQSTFDFSKQTDLFLSDYTGCVWVYVRGGGVTIISQRWFRPQMLMAEHRKAATITITKLLLWVMPTRAQTYSHAHTNPTHKGHIRKHARTSYGWPCRHKLASPGFVAAGGWFCVAAVEAAAVAGQSVDRAHRALLELHTKCMRVRSCVQSLWEMRHICRSLMPQLHDRGSVPWYEILKSSTPTHLLTCWRLTAFDILMLAENYEHTIFNS